MACNIRMPFTRNPMNTESGKENVMRRRLSYYHVIMIPGGPFRPIFPPPFKHGRLKNMKDEEEKYRIMSRVCLLSPRGCRKPILCQLYTFFSFFTVRKGFLIFGFLFFIYPC
jgi:hypothetical protein